ncbi:MAG: HYR domain-containing protein, partial [Myxococcaceae bacterium]
VPGNMTAEATSSAGAVVTFSTPVATDVVDGVRSVSCVPSSGSVIPLGTTSVACTATDTRGNSASTGFNITVADTTAPQLTAPVIGHVEATSASGAALSYTIPTATDVVDAAPVVSCSPVPGTVQPFGAGTGTCTATDSAGNVATASFTFEISDTTAPVITCPADVEAAATSESGAIVTFAAPVVTDAVSAGLDPQLSHASGSLFPVGDTTVTAGATDGAGLSASCSFLVRVTPFTEATTDGGTIDDGGTGGGDGNGGENPGSEPVSPKGCGCGSAAGAPLMLLAGFSALLRRRKIERST